MNFENLIFYIIFLLIIICSSSVIISNNAVYSVLFLILTFLNVVLLLLLLGVEFFAFLLLIVYVGAIAVLFLFVVMMLNIKINRFSDQINYFYPLIFIISLFFIDYFYSFTVYFELLKEFTQLNFWFNWVNEIKFKSNIETIGNLFYTDYCILFIISSFILLIAMIGAIVLTIKQKNNLISKKQKINKQLLRNSKNIVKFLIIRN